MKTIKNMLLFGALLSVSNSIFSQGTETRKVSPFINLETSGSFDVTLEQGSEESVKVVAEGIDPKKIITEVKENTLEIYLEKGNYRNIKTKVFVTYKNLEKIVNSGSGNLLCRSDLAASDFKLQASGSGDISIEGKIKAERTGLKVSGSGKIKLMSLETEDLQLSISGSGGLAISSGYAKKQSITLSGSGGLACFGMKSEICSIGITGSGGADVNVNKSLDASISGSGNINYKGDAQISKLAVSGSGKINKE